MTALAPPLAADGLVHPGDEAEIAALVRATGAAGGRLRVCGAGHAPAGTTAVDDPRGVRVSLDRLRGLRVIDAGERLVEAGAGIHLGADPGTAGPAGELRASLLARLAEELGWTLASTGGITHQTLGGFLATVSAGGTLRHSLLDQVVSIRLIDGTGEARTFSAGDGGPGLAAVLPSLGLLGVITAVTLRCEPLFTIAGQEAIISVEAAPFDLTGPGGPARPSLAGFLAEAEYARIEWWPQRGAERLLVWQAQRTTPEVGFRPTSYEEFTAYPVLAEGLIGALYVIFGNLGNPVRARRLLRRNAGEVRALLDRLAAAGLISSRLRRITGLLPAILDGTARLVGALALVGPALERALPRLVPWMLDRVLPLDTHKRGMRRGQPQSFRDWGWQGLPMDNQASDVLLASEFAELWVPLPRAAEAVGVLRGYFGEPADARESYRRTGLYPYELYGSPASTGWLHPGFSDGTDEWREGALRIDVYWFTANQEDPLESFFPTFWRLLRDHGIPFRLHWGKHVPASTPADPAWLELLRSRYPRWDDFLTLRAELDPGEVFLTDYWRDRLGVWSSGGDSGSQELRNATGASGLHSA